VSVRFVREILVGARNFSAIDLKDSSDFAQGELGVTFTLGAQRILVPWSAVLCIVHE
jgi:hypothetical protein